MKFSRMERSMECGAAAAATRPERKELGSSKCEPPICTDYTDKKETEWLILISVNLCLSVVDVWLPNLRSHLICAQHRAQAELDIHLRRSPHLPQSCGLPGERLRSVEKTP